MCVSATRSPKSAGTKPPLLNFACYATHHVQNPTSLCSLQLLLLLMQRKPIYTVLRASIMGQGLIVAPRAKSVCSFVSLVQTNLDTKSVCSLVTKRSNGFGCTNLDHSRSHKIEKNKNKNAFGPFSYKFFVPTRAGLRNHNYCSRSPATLRRILQRG